MSSAESPAEKATAVDTLSTGRTVSGCPWWCTSNHEAPLHVLEERDYRIRGHYGRERQLRAVRDEEGRDQTAATALVQVDHLDTGRRDPVGVNAICEGLLTPAQAARFAAMIASSAAEAREANRGGLVPTSDELRGAAR